MIKYELKNLTNRDFEIFCKDILEFVTNEKYRTFRYGKDSGIDLEPLKENINIFGQVKQYINTPDNTMLSNLKKERAKVEKKNPERYILFLAKSLTEGNYRKILEIFSPYLKKEDIYDEVRIQEILNNVEASYILDKWDKLWLPSPYFLERFYKVYKDSKYIYEKNQIIEESKFFVETDAYKNAYEMLEKSNLILIHGTPGAGKTTLARRLSIKYIKEDYELIYGHVDDLKEIEKQLCISENKKIIIIDDFLGSSLFELKGVSDNTLENIIKYVKKHNYVKLILTTRTYLYNNGKETHEKFNLLTKGISQLLIEVNEYSEIDKANMLYNHMYYNDLLWSSQYCNILEKRFYYNIIEHKNYTPRNVSMICEMLKDKNEGDIIELIKELLDDPTLIWDKEYKKLNDNTYGEQEKNLLNIIYIFNNEAYEKKVKEQYKEMLKEERKEYDEEAFEQCINNLSKAFIVISYDEKKKDNRYSFVNPSIEDFLINKFRKTPSLLIKYINFTKGIEPLYRIYKTNKDSKVKENIREIVEKNINKFNLNNSYEKRIIYTMFKETMTLKRNQIVKELIDFSFVNMNAENSDFITYLLANENEDEIYQYTLENFKKFEIDNQENFYKKIAYCLNDLYDLEVYLNICYTIIKKKNSQHMLNIVELLIDSMISIISDETENVMRDIINEIAEDLIKEHQDEDEFITAHGIAVSIIEESLRVLKKLYSKGLYEYIVSTVLGNLEACLLEEEIKELLEEKKDEYKRISVAEESRQYIKELFEENIDIHDSKKVAEKYLINNKKSQKLLNEISKKNYWYVEMFAENVIGVEFLISYIDKYNSFPNNPKEFGDKLVKNIQDHSRYVYLKEDVEIIETISMYIFKNSAYEFTIEDITNISNKSTLVHLIDILKNQKIIEEEDNVFRFTNIFFILFFAINKIKREDEDILYYFYEELIDDILEKFEDKIEDFRTKVLNLYASCDLEEFNNTYIIPDLYYLTSYIRTKDKYSISKSLISKLEPTISQYETINMALSVSRDFITPSYLGVDIIEDLSYFKIDTESKVLRKKCYREKDKMFDIDFEKAIRDEELKKELDNIRVWEYIEEVYFKLKEVYMILLKDSSIDVYKYFSHSEMQEKYLLKY